MYTGGKQDPSGTDMTVSLKLFGDNEISDEVKLTNTKSINFNQNRSLTHANKFLPNQVYFFVFF
jgi:hypothetical protein